MAEITPMMKQYLEIKEQNKDSYPLFPLGRLLRDVQRGCSARLARARFDADRPATAARRRSDQTPMCGIPYHSSEAYIARLIAKGYKVAICEQTEDPALAKGLVKRDIIRVITPGTVIDSACLDEPARQLPLRHLFATGRTPARAFCDMTTGHTHVTALFGRRPRRAPV